MLITDVNEPKPRKFDLRWRFDFNGRPTAYGHWSRGSDREEAETLKFYKEGIVRASIEAKDITTGDVRTLAECDGHDFVVFQWLAAASMTPNFRGDVIPFTRNYGLRMKTRDEMVEVYDTGDVALFARPEEDKKFNYAIFGK